MEDVGPDVWRDLLQYLDPPSRWALASIDRACATAGDTHVVRRWRNVMLEFHLSPHATQAAPWILDWWFQVRRPRPVPPAVGTLCLARDYLGGWCPARVLAERRVLRLPARRGWVLLHGPTVTIPHERMYRVRFLGWSSHWDEWVLDAVPLGSAPTGPRWLAMRGFAGKWYVTMVDAVPRRPWFPCTDVVLRVLQIRDHFTVARVPGMF